MNEFHNNLTLKSSSFNPYLANVNRLTLNEILLSVDKWNH